MMVLANMAAAEVPVVENPAEAPVKKVIEMEEVWRVGDNEEEEFIFGVIRQVFFDSQGNYLLLDIQQKELFKFSPTGEYLQTLCRQGEGPGELSMCFNCGIWDDSSVYCLNGYPQQFVRVENDGVPLSNVRITPLPLDAKGSSTFLYQVAVRDGHLVGSGQHMSFDRGNRTQSSFLSVFDRQGNETFCFDCRPTGYDFNKPIKVDEEAEFNPYSLWALDNSGQVYLAPERTEYLIEVRNLEGEVLKKFHRPWKKEKRTKEEKEKAKDGYSFTTNGGSLPDISYHMSDYSPAISSLRWVSDRLWVTSGQHGSEPREGLTEAVDIFDAEGNFVESRQYRLPFDGQNDRVIWLDENTIVVVEDIKSATSAMNTELIVQRGDKVDEPSEEDGFVLEVVLYKATS